MLISVLVSAGCDRGATLKVHYLDGFVPGTHAVFSPAKIAVAPTVGDLATGTHDIGALYSPTGELEKTFAISDAGALIGVALMTSLIEAGLEPIAFDSQMPSRDLQPGVDLMLTSAIEQFSVSKRFGEQQTLHGQYFTMTARVKVKIELQDRNGQILYANELVGIEEEPPKPVGGEVFLPLETDPAESLSVALSRAIGSLIVDQNFRKVLSTRAPSS
jgi:hypothetical protein